MITAHKQQGVAERLDDRGRRQLQRLDHGVVAHPAQGSHQDEQRPVRERRRAPGERHHEAQRRRAYAQLPEQAGLGGVDPADHPGQHLVERIEGHRHQRHDGCRLDHAQPRPDDDQDAQEAHPHRDPAAAAGGLAQQRHGQGGHRQRGERQHGMHVGQRHLAEAPDHEPDLDHEQDRAQHLQPGDGRAHRAAGTTWPQDQQRQGNGEHEAQPDDLRYRVEHAQIFAGGIHQPEHEHRQQRDQDAAKLGREPADDRGGGQAQPRPGNGGRRVENPTARSNAAATRSSSPSANGLATSWSPIGRPSASRPTGRLSAGKPR